MRKSNTSVIVFPLTQCKKQKQKQKPITFRDETQNIHFASARKEKLQINNGHNMTDNVELTGTVVCPTEPYLSVSPDGFIKRDTILEIKCPQKPPSDLAASGKYDIV